MKTPMKIGVLSDTHISSPAESLPQEMLARFRKEKVEMILHAGDMIHKHVLDTLAQIAQVKGVAGNMDGPGVRAKLPKKSVEAVGGVRIGMIHGSGPPTRLGERLLPTFEGDEIDVLVYGHSHQPKNEEYQGVLLFNPGAAHAGRGGRAATFGILTVEDGHVYGEIIRIS